MSVSVSQAAQAESAPHRLTRFPVSGVSGEWSVSVGHNQPRPVLCEWDKHGDLSESEMS